MSDDSDHGIVTVIAKEAQHPEYWNSQKSSLCNIHAAWTLILKHYITKHIKNQNKQDSALCKHIQMCNNHDV